MKRASKRLINAIIALVASVILCIGVCLAWFAMNNNVSGEGMQTQVKSGDIVDFNVTAYYLNYDNNSYSVTEGNFTLNGKDIEVDHNNDKIINTLTSESGGSTQKDEMRPYSVSGGYTTAVLFKVDYEIVDGSQKKFRIFAECDKNSRLKVTDEDKDGNFTSYLSNAVTFFSATQSATQSGTSTFAAGDDTTLDYTYTTGAESTAFVGGVGLREKSFHIDLSKGITITSLGEGKKNSNGNYENTEYFIMDYEKERFTYISSLLLESGGGLNSGLTLTGDITLGIEEYTEATVTPTDIKVDDKAYNHSTAYKQPMSTVDIMTPNWQFVVTYSDGSQKIIVGTNSGLSITAKDSIEKIDTTTVGTGEATASYKEGTADPISCPVSYTIGLVITGGSGVAIDKTLTLSASGLGDTTITWSSSDTSVATVDSEGVVTGVAEGTVKITATAAGYDKDDTSTHYLKAEYVITVTEKEVAVTGVTLNTDTLNLGIGNKASLLATVAPSNATNKAITWSSSDPTVANVVDGVVTALKSGETTITVTTQGKGSDGTTTYSASCTVTVSATVAVTSVTITGTTSEIAVDGTTTLSVTVMPETASDKSVKWTIVNGTGSASITSSSNTSCTIKGVSPGTVTVKAEAGGKSDSYAITVTGVKLDKTSATLIMGSTLELTATAYTTAASYTFSWATSNASVASIKFTDNVCTVTPVATSETAVTITVTLTIGDNTYTATCTITVVAKTYTVTFYDDDGKTVISSPTFKEGEAITAPGNPSKTATAQYTYEFNGWYDAKTGGNKITNFGTVSDSAILSYYARYTATTRKYTYTFYVDGTATKTATVDYGTTIEAPDNPEKSGYTFDGWFTEESGGTQVTEFGTISANVNYYAHWTKDSSGGTTATYTLSASDGLPTSGVFTHSGLVIESSAFKFGENTDTLTITLADLKAGQTVDITLNCSTSSNKQVTYVITATGAKTDGTKDTFTSKVLSSDYADVVADTFVVSSDGAVTFVVTRGGGGTLLVKSATVVVKDSSGSSTTPTKYTVTFKNGDTVLQTGEVEEGTKPTYTGAPPEKASTEQYTYTFSGWLAEGDTGEPIATADLPVVSGAVTYVAQFSQTTRKYTVTFMDGSNKLSESEVNYNTAVTQPANPEKTGYTFVQWCSDEGLTTGFVFTTAITADTTLYAKWTINKYTVTFDMNGHGEVITAQEIEYNKTATEPTPEPTATGYTFGGWYTDAACSDGNEFSFTTAITEDTTIYAKWTATTDYTANGTYQLDIANSGATPGIYTWTKATGGFTTASDSTKVFKLTSSSGTNYDYLYINATLKAEDKIYISGVARPSSSTGNTTLAVALKGDSTATVSGIVAEQVFTTSAVINQTITVTSEGAVIIQLSRKTGNTGCELTNLYVGINEVPTVPVDSVTLSDTTATLQVGGETLTLTPAIAPLNASNTAVTWSTSDNKVATVVDGVVTAVGAGTATITVTTEDGSKTAECVVTVESTTPTSIVLKEGTTTFKKGSTASTSDWTFTITYSDSTIKEVTVSNVTITGDISTTTANNDLSVNASYTENGTTVNCTVTYKVIEPQSIVYVTDTGTTTFTQGSEASTAGWQFTVTYSDDSTTEKVTAPDSRLSIGEISTTTVTDSGSVEVSYTECGKTVKCNVSYKVTAASVTTTKVVMYFTNGSTTAVKKWDGTAWAADTSIVSSSSVAKGTGAASTYSSANLDYDNGTSDTTDDITDGVTLKVESGFSLKFKLETSAKITIYYTFKNTTTSGNSLTLSDGTTTNNISFNKVSTAYSLGTLEYSSTLSAGDYTIGRLQEIGIAFIVFEAV